MFNSFYYLIYTRIFKSFFYYHQSLPLRYIRIYHRVFFFCLVYPDLFICFTLSSFTNSLFYKFPCNPWSFFFDYTLLFVLHSPEVTVSFQKDRRSVLSFYLDRTSLCVFVDTRRDVVVSHSPVLSSVGSRCPFLSVLCLLFVIVLLIVTNVLRKFVFYFSLR